MITDNLTTQVGGSSSQHSGDRQGEDKAAGERRGGRGGAGEGKGGGGVKGASLVHRAIAAAIADPTFQRRPVAAGEL